MEAYEHRTREVIELFLNDCITLPDCIAAIDAEIPRLRIVMLSNNGIVMKEIERRGA
jgi:hypothetical protein